MHGQTLVGVYAARADANRVHDSLLNAGISESDIRLSREGPEEQLETADQPHRKSGFWDWLFGTDVPEDDRVRYESSLRQGSTAVSVRLRDATERSRVESILEEFSPVNIHAESSPQPSTMAGAEGSTETEQRIPVAKEELQVGKRRTEQSYRIRVYPVEHPVEEQVNLRDERVEIERRPASGQVTRGEGGLQARDIEVRETHEEPVVSKNVRADEEVVVRKNVKERTETVRDTVRETKVDVDKAETDADLKGTRRP